MSLMDRGIRGLLSLLIGAMFVVSGAPGCGAYGGGLLPPSAACIEEIDDGQVEYDDDCLEALAYGGPLFHYDSYYSDYDYYYLGTVLGYGDVIYDDYFYDTYYYEGWYDGCWDCYYSYEDLNYWDAVYYDYFGY